MKNVTPKIAIRSTLQIPEAFQESIDEKRQALQAGEALIPAVLETLEHNSSETYLSGTIELGIVNGDRLQKDIWQVPVLSRFLFTYSNEAEMDPHWLICLS